MEPSVHGCSGCATTAGPGSCPVHGQKVHYVAPSDPKTVLPSTLIGVMMADKDKEIDRLRAENAELLDALKKIQASVDENGEDTNPEYLAEIANCAIVKVGKGNER